MSAVPNRRSPLPLAAAICVVLVIALGAAGFDQYFRSPLLETGDTAVNALQIDHAGDFRELYGNYSRFEFNHPGPAFFYVYAAGEWLLHDLLHVVPSPGNAHLLTSMFVQCCFFALALGLIATHVSGRLWLGVAALAATLYFGPMQVPFMSNWPPYVLLMPFLCFLVACCSLACGRIDHLPAVVLSGGFLFHGHAAQPLFVGGLGTLSLVLAARHLRRESPADHWRQHAVRHRRWLVVAGVLAGLFTLPLVIDVALYGRTSNVATIIGRFYANTGDSKSVLQSFLYFVSYATPAQNQEDVFTTMGPAVRLFFAEHAARVIIWAAILLLGPCLAFLRPARVPPETRRFLLTAHLFIGVAILLSILWGMAQARTMTHFNSFFYYGIYFLGFLLVVGWIDSLTQLPVPPAVTAALCAIAAVIATWEFRMPRWSEIDAGLPIQRAISTAIAQGSRAPRMLSFEHSSWPAVASLALELQRHDIPFHTEPWWEFMFGRRHNIQRLGEKPEAAAEVWWITGKDTGGTGLPLNDTLSLFTKAAPLRPTGGDVISFRGSANGFRYVVSGLTAGNINFAQTVLPRLVLMFDPVPAEHDVQLGFDVAGCQPRSEFSPGIVYLNDREVARVAAGARSVYPVVIPRDLWNSRQPAVLEIRFPEAQPFSALKRPAYQWWPAWNIWAIRVLPAP